MYFNAVTACLKIVQKVAMKIGAVGSVIDLVQYLWVGRKFLLLLLFVLISFSSSSHSAS